MPKLTKEDADRIHITLKGPMLAMIQAAIVGTGYTPKEFVLASVRSRLQQVLAARPAAAPEAPATSAPAAGPAHTSTTDEGPGF